MLLSNMIADLRVELHDSDPTSYLFEDTELIRAIEKSVSLMSRLIPKRTITETTITRIITGETLTISSSTGTLAYKPIKSGSLVITGKTLDTHYKVNYLTGVVTEIGALLPDTTYSASYELDSNILDLSTFLTDYIKIERVEYPVGGNPPSNLTFDQYGGLLALRGKDFQLTASEHLRIIYLAKWIAPTLAVKGDYPEHLDNAVIIGSAGQALIFEAEKYTQLAADEAAIADALITAITALTEPAGYASAAATIVAATGAPTAPTALTIGFAGTENIPMNTYNTTLALIGSTDNPLAQGYLSTGAAFINAATRGDQVATQYAGYASAVMETSKIRIEEVAARLKSYEMILLNYQAQVSAFNAAANVYQATASWQVGNANALVAGERNQVDGASSEIAAYNGTVTARLGQLAQSVTLVDKYLDIAGRYLASGQAKINEFLIMIGIKSEFNFNKASSEQRE
jgi:hypothetical protein